MSDTPGLWRRDTEGASVFRPANLLRESRRQKDLPDLPVPEVCILDPDGDMVRHLRAEGAVRHAGWACYHTELDVFERDGRPLGIVGGAIGAPFAVLVAEQLFASGCRLLISVTSAGRIAELGPEPSFILCDRALRDEGTSFHYLPQAPTVEADAALTARAWLALSGTGLPLRRGMLWTTDAPFRETAAAIAAARAAGALAVEMEAAALYAFARAQARAVICLAHVTNAMAQNEGDFEKGEAEGALDALKVVEAIVRDVLS